MVPVTAGIMPIYLLVIRLVLPTHCSPPFTLPTGSLTSANEHSGSSDKMKAHLMPIHVLVIENTTKQFYQHLLLLPPLPPPIGFPLNPKPSPQLGSTVAVVTA
jgi:hypothetical protein